jgi:hypothetical protein
MNSKVFDYFLDTLMEGYYQTVISSLVVRALADVVGAAVGTEGMEGMLACSVRDIHVYVCYTTHRL